MSLRTVCLELARTPEFPDGSSWRGYEFVAPLAETGQLDYEEWKANQRYCTVRRFWEGEEEQTGTLIHTRHGTWAFSYAPGAEDDEALHRLQDHVFRQGEYVTVRQHDGRALPFRVAWIV